MPGTETGRTDSAALPQPIHQELPEAKHGFSFRDRECLTRAQRGAFHEQSVKPGVMMDGRGHQLTARELLQGRPDEFAPPRPARTPPPLPDRLQKTLKVHPCLALR